MKEKYKILLNCYDPYCEPFQDEISGEFGSITEAQNVMLRCAIEEAHSLNESYMDDNPIVRVYTVVPDGDNSVTVYTNYTDNAKRVMLTEYQIAPYSEYQRQAYNDKIIEKYGPGTTVEIKSYIEDDDSIWFYYTSNRCGDSDAYESIEQAYEMANDYLDNIDLYI